MDDTKDGNGAETLARDVHDGSVLGQLAARHQRVGQRHCACNQIALFNFIDLYRRSPDSGPQACRPRSPHLRRRTCLHLFLFFSSLSLSLALSLAGESTCLRRVQGSWLVGVEVLSLGFRV